LSASSSAFFGLEMRLVSLQAPTAWVLGGEIRISTPNKAELNPD
jgi:hypothetical protein